MQCRYIINNNKFPGVNILPHRKELTKFYVLLKVTTILLRHPGLEKKVTQAV